jgi:hypothetical protein
MTDQSLAVELGAARDRIKEQGIELAHLRNLLAEKDATIAKLEAANDILLAGHAANIKLLTDALHEHTKVGA